jgi:hypothetical protein
LFLLFREAALRKEMQETLARCKGKEPGTGNIRGIGAEKRVKRVEIPEGVLEGTFPLMANFCSCWVMALAHMSCGKTVYQVSARFPGPTTPRDFVTVLMMPRPAEGKSDRTGRQPRQFVIVSRPCDGHPDCPSRSGFIRGQYESVEVIREVPVDKPLRRVKSSIDLSRDDVKQLADEAGDHASKEAVLRAAKKAAESEGEQDGKVSFPGSPAKSSGGRDEEDEMAIEWLMVTRSDPGGSVPRFMVEKGTPGGIVNDAGKFIKWLSSQKREDLLAASTDGVDQQETKPTEGSRQKAESGERPARIAKHDHLQDGHAPREGEHPPQGGLYGMFTNALGAASSAVASRVAAFNPSYPIVDGTGSADESYASSEASFESAEEGSPSSSLADQVSVRGEASAMDAASTKSAHSALSENPPLSHQESTSLSRTQAQHEKELRKLKQRMVKAQEKLERSQAKRRADSKSSNKGGGTTTTDDEETAATAAAKAKEKEKDDLALAKLREKHEREIAKQEEKYRRELKRLEEKHAAEERKAAERRRKAAERKERANIQMELERTRAERDVALKQIEMLKAQVGELQAQNTMLVAKLGKEKEKGNLKDGAGKVAV